MKATCNWKFLSLGVFCLLLIPSCSKTEVGSGIHTGDVTLSGTVRDEISGKPIPFATAMIMRKHRDAGWGGMSVLEKTQADSLGQFKLEFNADTRDYVYSLDANALTYFNKNLDGSDRIDFTQGQYILQDVVLIPMGFLTYRIFGNKGGSSMKLKFHNDPGPFYQGADTVRTVVFEPANIQTIGYRIYDHKNQIISDITDSVSIAPHDTTYYLIEF